MWTPRLLGFQIRNGDAAILPSPMSIQPTCSTSSPLYKFPSLPCIRSSLPSLHFAYHFTLHYSSPPTMGITPIASPFDAIIFGEYRPTHAFSLSSPFQITLSYFLILIIKQIWTTPCTPPPPESTAASRGTSNFFSSRNADSQNPKLSLSELNYSKPTEAPSPVCESV